MTDGICAADGCERPNAPHRIHCPGHHSRLSKTGSLGTTPIRVWTPSQDQQCSVDDCATPARTRGMCVKHYTRFKRHGDPTFVTLPIGPNNNYWRGDDVGPAAAHDRVARLHGRAAEHSCVKCGRTAQHWAYDHLDPDEKSSKAGPYSTKPKHYQPMCVPCHKRFDLDYLARSRSLTVSA
jgi:hypothetical protein